MRNWRFAGDKSLRNNPAHSGKIDARAFAGFDYRSRFRFRARLLAITGRGHSRLGRRADVAFGNAAVRTGAADLCKVDPKLSRDSSGNR